MRNLDIAAIHGRFQPFHLGHLDYATKALDWADRLYVQITSPDEHARRLESSGTHRHLEESNPFFFFERMEMVMRSLLPHAADRVFVVPLDLSRPESWGAYTPSTAVQLVTVHEEWDQHKATEFLKAGYEVEYLESRPQRPFTGTRVRGELRSGGDWRALVPDGTAEVISQLLSAEGNLTRLGVDDFAD